MKVIKSANPYMPLWENVPDGEPRVFEYNGEKRVYLYGSHDLLRTEYCGRDYVVWSAPVNDLTDWKCHGVSYRAADDAILYAPDCVEKDGKYYLYTADNNGSDIYVAESDNPAGPFVNPRKTDLGFDPGILVDDDGRVYAYWGFGKSFAAELNDDMATIKKETLVTNLIGHSRYPMYFDKDGENDVDGFFEASSPRKVNGKYVLIYSKLYGEPNETYGTGKFTNAFLSYMYSDSPLGEYVHGGDISFNGGNLITVDGKPHMTYQWGNNHGSLEYIEGQWYIFYHRQTGTDEFLRQAMVEPVEVALDDDGRIFIGKVIYEEINGNKVPVASVPVEMTSQGANTEGLDCTSVISAGYACHIYRPGIIYEPFTKKNPYIDTTYASRENPSAPVVNIQNGTTVGFRYIRFGCGNDGCEGCNSNGVTKVNIKLFTPYNIRVNVRLDSHDGEIVGSTEVNTRVDDIFIKRNYDVYTVDINKDKIAELKGKRAVYFEFIADTDDEAARFDSFWFE